MPSFTYFVKKTFPTRLISSLFSLSIAYPHLVNSMEADIDLNPNIAYVRGIQGSDRIVNIGVLGASYLISPVSDDKIFLSVIDGKLGFNSVIDKKSLFSFEESNQSPPLFSLRNLQTNNIVGNKNQEQNLLYIKMHSENIFNLRFIAGHRAPRSSYLHQDKGVITFKDSAEALSQQNFLWTLKPVFIMDLSLKNIDPDTLLFKIPTAEPISGKRFSRNQIQQIYDLHYKKTGENFKILREDGDYILASTLALFYFAELNIYSEDFYLKITGLSGIRKQFDHTNGLSIVKADTVELPKNKTLYLKPQLDNQIPALGKIKIQPGVEGWNSLFWSALGYKKMPSYDKTPITLFQIIKSAIQGKHQINTPTYLCKFDKSSHSIFFYLNNKNVITNPGNATYLAEHFAHEMAKDMSIPIIRLAGSIEQFGRDIKVSSTEIANALEESSKNLSIGMRYSSKQLARAITYASGDFYDAVEFLSLTAKDISSDIKKHLPGVVKNLTNSMDLLSKALEKSSDNLKDGAIEASQSFHAAFQELKGACESLENGATDVSSSIEVASRNFIVGMQKLKDAANSKINVNHSVSFLGLKL